MEAPICSSCTFISSEVPETLASERKQSIKSTITQRRMNGGADDKTSTYNSKMSNKDPESESLATNNAQKSGGQSRYCTQDFQTRTLDSLRALPSSELNKVYPSTSNLPDKKESLKRRSLDNGAMCFCVSSHATRSTGEEKKIDEMMDYAIQNLNEAGKALSNLGDNFEHDLKLMFMDIMGRVQHWVSVVQNRIHAASADLESLRKESNARVSDQSAKDLELTALHKKLEESEAKLNALQKKRLEITLDTGRASQTGWKMVSTSVQTDTDQDKVEKKNESQSENAGNSVNTGSQCQDDRQKSTNREAELEAELAQLHEEKERMIKEHAEYESAIHCALLKGVSSLNIEALKVLRYPPIPCCAPCGLSSPHSTSPEPTVPSRPRTTRCDTAPPQPVQRGSNAVPKNNKIKSKNSMTNANSYQPLSEYEVYCSEGSGKSLENNMVFVLQHGDAGNQCQPCVQARYRHNGTPINKGTVCVGGKCRKPATTNTKQKVSPTTKSPGSRSTSYDLCVRNRDDSSENSTGNKNTLIAKRCVTCNGSHRTKDAD